MPINQVFNSFNGLEFKYIKTVTDATDVKTRDTINATKRFVCVVVDTNFVLIIFERHDPHKINNTTKKTKSIDIE